ncbi:sulfite exporter TauE/SafE family protein [Octadecabacter sp. CECT 8868]|uniref:sulfite exporter TauE/SafE family protein n=1 Tax=Octadecabacter algicola TaxID=2909342 RepID=UPI001F30FAFD|nr:sulfite exporter TauE/SafE family protein [Octadecabacter algicola]MCF2905734.1 sulfite exporter TauE/SafE family protein [Octadecabacter algicola]
MEYLHGIDGIGTLLFILAVATFSGVVKGVVGFAMPMILISGMTLVLPPEQALAALILPTLLTNVWQSLRQGLQSALQTIREFRVFLLCLVLLLVMSAQLVRILEPQMLYALIGLPVALFSVLQLAGWKPKLSARSTRLDAVIGSFAGFVGGISGVWGPPTVSYLTAVNTPKQDQMRAQGVIYGIGAIALAGAHLQTGVLRSENLPLTLTILPFAFAGLWIGFRLQDQIPQEKFRMLTLVVLAVAGLNLIRRAVLG